MIHTLNCSFEKCFASLTWRHSVVVSTGHIPTHQAWSLDNVFFFYIFGKSSTAADGGGGTLKSIWWRRSRRQMLSCDWLTSHTTASWLADILIYKDNLWMSRSRKAQLENLLNVSIQWINIWADVLLTSGNIFDKIV